MRDVRRFSSLATTAALALLFTTCGPTGAPTPEPRLPPEPTPAETGPPGRITGRALLDGAIDPPLLDMLADPGCVHLHEHGVEEQGVRVDDDGRLENVLVLIREGLDPADYDPPAEAKLLDQIGCLFKPRVQGVQAGQPLVVRNSDPVLHNVQAVPTNNPELNFGQPFQGMETEVVFETPEPMIRVKCDIHPWMAAYLAVIEHPFFDTTGADGGFVIADLPPGEYTVAAWHEVLGEQKAEVTVAAGEAVDLEFRFGVGETAP